MTTTTVETEVSNVVRSRMAKNYHELRPSPTRVTSLNPRSLANGAGFILGGVCFFLKSHSSSYEVPIEPLHLPSSAPIMITLPLHTEPAALRTPHQRGLTSNGARKGVVEAEPMAQNHAQPQAVAAAPLVPELANLASPAVDSGAGSSSFAVSASTLGELLTRINMSGARVAARLTDATRRVHIASLRPTPDADGRSMVARLQVSDGTVGGTDTVEVDLAPAARADLAGGESIAEAVEPTVKARVSEPKARQSSRGTLIDVVG